MTTTTHNQKTESSKTKKEKKKKCEIHLAYVAERDLLRGGVEKREALVLGGEFVGVVDPVVAGVAESCLVGGAKHRRFFSTTDVAVDLHLLAIRSRDGGLWNLE